MKSRYFHADKSVEEVEENGNVLWLHDIGHSVQNATDLRRKSFIHIRVSSEDANNADVELHSEFTAGSLLAVLSSLYVQTHHQILPASSPWHLTDNIRNMQHVLTNEQGTISLLL